MPVTEAQTAALRAFLAGDGEGMTLLAYQLGEKGMPGYLQLAEAALSVAAGKRFGPVFTSGDLVRYVAGARIARMADGHDFDFDPVAGENVLRSSLGQPVPRPADPGERLRAVVALLDALAGSEVHSASDVDDLLAQARALADRWLATSGPVEWGGPD
jgi:hypothetical protein